MNARRTTVVILGGTFDPIHNGHMAAAQQAQKAMVADEAWLIPALQSPWRDAPVATSEVRWKMVHAAIEHQPHMRALDIELRRSAPSYTIDTVEQLHHDFPHHDMWFVIGADTAAGVHEWHRSDELLAAVSFVIVNRSGAAPFLPEQMSTFGFAPQRTRLVEIESPPISSTAVRAAVAQQRSIASLVPPQVAQIITVHGLYR